jgi:hypothetical protein
MHGNDVGMPKACGRLCLTHKAHLLFGRGEPSTRHDLKGDNVSELDVPGRVNRAHAAPTNLFDNLVRVQLRWDIIRLRHPRGWSRRA